MTKTKTFFEFKPYEYLSHYYNNIGPENDFLLRALVTAYKQIKRKKSLLIFGSGPTIYSSIPASAWVKEIFFAEYLSENLDEVRKWIQKDKDAFNWDNYISGSLKYEGKKTSKVAVCNRRNLIQKKTQDYLFCDARDEFPLGREHNRLYEIVQMDFVAESITDSLDELKSILKNVCGIITSGGYLSMFSIKRANYYLINNNKFPAVSIDKNVLQPIFESLNLELKSYDEVLAEVDNGYEGMMHFLCQKK